MEVPPAPLETQETAGTGTATVTATVMVMEIATAMAPEQVLVPEAPGQEQALGQATVMAARDMVITARQEIRRAILTVAVKDTVKGTASTSKTATTTRTTDRIPCPSHSALLAICPEDDCNPLRLFSRP